MTVGDLLPAVEVPLTRTSIVATALATRDFQDVHHDPTLAQERGSKDVFMNILTTNGICERYMCGWAGPAARLKKLSIRLGAPNYAGDTMTLTGEVTEVDGDRVTVAVVGTNSLGSHVSGTAVVQLPDSAATAYEGAK
ncbi:MAG: MaoC family dehydratase [Tetrasphaera sp.]|nr:MaoC family dehydratase [Tetrasphaera sp.]